MQLIISIKHIQCIVSHFTVGRSLWGKVGSLKMAPLGNCPVMPNSPRYFTLWPQLINNHLWILTLFTAGCSLNSKVGHYELIDESGLPGYFPVMSTLCSYSTWWPEPIQLVLSTSHAYFDILQQVEHLRRNRRGIKMWTEVCMDGQVENIMSEAT